MVKPSGKKILPVFQSMVSLIIPFTKSTTHSIKFCAPVGFIFKFRVTNRHKKKTIAHVSMIINMLGKLKSSPGIPNAYSMTSVAELSKIYHLFSIVVYCATLIYSSENNMCLYYNYV